MPIYTPSTSSAVATGNVGSTVNVATDGIYNSASGQIDLARGFLGIQVVTELVAEGQLSQIIVVLRAILLALTATNALLGLGNASTKSADELQMADLLARATRSGLALTDANTLV